MKTQRVLILLFIFVITFVFLGEAISLIRPATAAPNVPDTPLTYQWDPQFGPLPGLGADDDIRAVARHPNGDIYVGGSFVNVGGVIAFHVARWDGTQWHALEGGNFNGVDGSVNAIAIDPNTGYVYVGGSFANIGGYGNGPRACSVARWNPTGQWSPLADSNGYVGVSGFPVYALAVSGSYVYAGGYLNGAANSGLCGSGTVTANALVRWDKATGDWSDVGGSMGDGFDMVYSLAYDGSSYLYAGGYFAQAGGVTVNNIAQWNDTSWAALGTGTDAEVKAVAITGTAVYAGGDFSNAGGAAANHIARWSGGGWSSLGGGLTTSFSGCWSAVHGIALDGTNVYATGHFNRAGGLAALNVAQWNGSSWAALGNGLGATPTECSNFGDYGSGLVHDGADLYAGGFFQEAGGNPSHYFARWTNSLAEPDLLLLKWADQITVPIGGEVMYTLQLVHDGNVTADATQVIVSDVLPVELDYVSYDATRGTYSSASGLWNVGTLNQWEAVYLNITGTVNNSATVGQVVTNTAVIHSADQPDPNIANNQGSVAITVTAAQAPSAQFMLYLPLIKR